MGRSSIGKRVARAAAAGGGRAYGSRPPLGWYLTLVLICAAGLSLIGYSRYERLHPGPVTSSHPHASSPATPPTLADHWQAALAIDVCGRLEPNLPESKDILVGLRTFGNGIIDIEPSAAPDPKAYEGAHANLGTFLATAGVVLSPSALSLPPLGGAKAATYRSGVTRCGAVAGRVEVEVWPSPSATRGTLVAADPAQLTLHDGEMVTIGFVAPGTVLPRPPARALLARFLAQNPHGLVTGTSPASSTPATSSRTP